MRLRLLVFGMLLAAWLPAWSGEDAVHVVSAAAAEAPLVPAARIVRDADGRMTVGHIVAHEELPALAESSRTASFGFSSAAYWFSVMIDNPGERPLRRLLAFEPTWLDDVQVTLIRSDGTLRSQFGGDRLKFSQRAIPHRQINFELDLPPGRSRLLVRVQTRDPFLVNMTLWEPSAFFAADAAEGRYFGFVYGAMAALLLFNLVLFFSVREPVYATYVAYLATFMAAHATYNGHLFPLLWPDSPVWGNWAHSTFIYLFMLAGITFAINFLDLPAKRPQLYRWAKGFGLAMAASMVLTGLVGGYAFHVATSIFWVVVYSPFVLFLGLRSFQQGNRASRFFLSATTAGFIGSFVTASTVAGLIPYSFTAYRAVDIGMLVDAVLLSLALADRLRLSRAEADRAKAELIEAGRRYARELEETVARRTGELMEANAVKDKFFAIVAHDLRGPIGGLAALFGGPIATPADLTPETLAVVRAATQNTQTFLEELLAWARSQRGEIDLRPKAIDIPRLLHETQELFAVQAQAKGVHLDLQLTEECWVYADPSMIHTVLRNLVHNALKFTESGGTVRAGLERETERCWISIADTGIGMSRSILENVFRLDVKPQSSPGTRNESGTGLGLVLCKEFIEKNGGTIEVRSEPGQGSTFRFSLPLARESEIVAPAAIRAIAINANVLVAEDDPLHREAAERVLHSLGCTLAFAADGKEAVRLASEQDFDLILMDIDMPDIDGIEAARRIRAAGKPARIVSLSSYSRHDLDRLFAESPFDDCLYKPLNLDDAMTVMLSIPRPRKQEPSP